MSKFDPHQYVIEGGWDFTSIEKTALLGVAEADEEILSEMYGEDARAASDALLAFCRQRVAEAA